MKPLKRRQLPSFIKLSLKLDIQELCEEYLKLQKRNDLWKYKKAYRRLRSSYSELNNLTDSFDFSNYTQVDLTEFDSNFENTSEDVFCIRNTRAGRTLKKSQFNERRYNQKNDLCTPYWLKIINSFSSPVTRARFAIMKPYSKIKPHCDYDTDFSIRLHIPIFSNSKVRFFVKRVGYDKIESFFMEPDGHIYFLNQGMLHWVENAGSYERVHLVLSVNGQKDILKFSENKKVMKL